MRPTTAVARAAPASVGCFTQGSSATQDSVNLLATGEKYGKGVRLMTF